MECVLMSKSLPDRSVHFVSREIDLGKLHGALEKALNGNTVSRSSKLMGPLQRAQSNRGL
jgi:hypothetical protein